MNNFNKEKSNYLSYINKNIPFKPVQTNLMQVGSFININTIYGTELAMVICYITKYELKKYLKDNNVEYNQKDIFWFNNYALLGHYKTSEVTELVRNNQDDKTPELNLLVVSIQSKTNYQVLSESSPKILKLFEILKIIAVKQNPNINEIVKNLLNATVMSLATKDMRRAYQSQISENNLTEPVNKRGTDDV